MNNLLVFELKIRLVKKISCLYQTMFLKISWRSLLTCLHFLTCHLCFKLSSWLCTERWLSSFDFFVFIEIVIRNGSFGNACLNLLVRLDEIALLLFQNSYQTSTLMNVKDLKRMIYIKPKTIYLFVLIWTEEWFFWLFWFGLPIYIFIFKYIWWTILG